MTTSTGPDALRGLLLDRDGTINVSPPEGDWVRSADDLTLLPGVPEAIAAFNEAGWVVAVVTNQRAVSLGLMTAADVAAVHRRLSRLLADAGAWIDAYYVCPHAEGECDCRKPLPGMLTKALTDWSLDPRSSVMAGDRESDVAAGRSAGCVTARLADPCRPVAGTLADLVVPDLPALAEALLGPAVRADGRG